MMTAPAAPPPHPAVWGKETVTLTPTVLETWCVAQTTVLLGHPHWTVVKKVRSTFISFKKHIRQDVKLDLLDLAMIYLPTIDSAGGGGSSTSSPCNGILQRLI